MKQTLRPKGFTLVEILIVLGIVGGLAALLFPVFSRVREKGRSAVCQSNLKQIAIAMQQYVQDNSGTYPAMQYVQAGEIVRWNDAIMPYVKDHAIFRCPTRQSKNPENPETDYSYNWLGLSKIVWEDSDPDRHILFGNTQFVGAHESSIVVSPAIVLLNDEGGPSSVDGGPDTDVVETSWGQRLWLPALHSGGANDSYIDGHVKWRSKQEQTGAG